MEQQGINFAAIPQTAIKVITAPAEFFREMPKKGGFVEPLVFMLVMGVLSGIIQAVVSLLGLNIVGGVAAGVAAVVIMPIAILVFGFIAAGIMFVIWKLLGSQEDYETAYRCVAYTAAFSPIMTVLGLVPYLGVVATTGISVVLMVLVSVAVHSIEAKKAWLVFGILGGIMLLVNLSAQVASRALKGGMENTANQMQENAAKMQDAAKQMQDEAQRLADEAKKHSEAAQGVANDAAGHANDAAASASGSVSQMQDAANKQLDESIRQMEAQMKMMPPEQQAQMRAAIEQMKQSRAGR